MCLKCLWYHCIFSLNTISFGHVTCFFPNREKRLCDDLKEALYRRLLYFKHCTMSENLSSFTGWPLITCIHQTLERVFYPITPGSSSKIVFLVFGNVIKNSLSCCIIIFHHSTRTVRGGVVKFHVCLPRFLHFD